MLKARTQWLLPERNFEQEQKLIHEFNISPLVARILIQRGFNETIPLFKEKDSEKSFQMSIKDRNLLSENLAIDVVCQLSEVDVGEIEKLSLFGQENHHPTFLLNDVELSQIRAVGIDKSDLKCQLRQEDRALEGTGFQLGELVKKISKQVRANVVGEFVLQEWNGIQRPQFLIKDIEVAQTQIFDYRGTKVKTSQMPLQLDTSSLIMCFRKQSLIELEKHFGEQIQEKVCLTASQSDGDFPFKGEVYDLFLYDLPFSTRQLHKILGRIPNRKRVYCLFGAEHQNQLVTIPSREHFKWLYGFIIQKGQYQWEWTKKLAQARKISEHAITFILQVFLDLHFIEKKEDKIYPVTSPVKRELSESMVYQQKIEELRMETELLYTSYEELCQTLNKDTLNGSD